MLAPKSIASKSYPNPGNSTNIVHTFRNATVNPPVGGTIALANTDNFPALVGTNLAVALGFINAWVSTPLTCTLAPPSS